MRFKTANRIVQHYRIDGPQDAPTIVFLNSLGTDFRIWDGTVAALGGGFRILRYDMRGHGLTTLTDGPYAIDGLAADALALMDAVGIGRAHLVGLSVGGMVAQHIAAAAPGRVEKLVLMDTAHKIGTPEMWQTRIDALLDGGMESIAEAVLDRWFAPAYRHAAPEAFAGAAAMLTRTPLHGYAAVCGAIRDADLTDAAATIAADTLCLCGSDDKATPPDLVLALADLIPNARYETVENAGHLPCLEHPETVAGRILGHFGKA